MACLGSCNTARRPRHSAVCLSFPAPCPRSNHCPFVVHLKPALVELAKEYQGKGVKVVAISSNSVETHPQVLEVVLFNGPA